MSIRKYNRPRRQIIIPIGPSIAYIPLTRGLYALIDKDDASIIPDYSWQAEYCRTSKGYYAVTHVSAGGQNQKKIRLQRFLMGFPSCLVDHKNRKTLDNRRCNLRLADRSQNNWNCDRNSKSGAKGVDWRPESKKWRARIGVRKKTIALGYFERFEDAKEAYRVASIKYHGEFSSLVLS